MSSANLTVSLPAGRTHTVSITASNATTLARKAAQYICDHAARVGVAPIALNYRITLA